VASGPVNGVAVNILERTMYGVYEVMTPTLIYYVNYVDP